MRQNLQKFAVIVPIRGLQSSMSRLRSHLREEQVNKIVKFLFDKTVSILSKLDFPLIIVTPDISINDDYFDFDVLITRDYGTSLNEAIFLVTKSYNYDYYLLVMPDLPGLKAKHLQILFKLMELFDNIIIPTQNQGTAIALLSKRMFKMKYFGQNSSQNIIEHALNEKLQISKLNIKELNRDLDTYDDLKYWKNSIPINSNL